MLDKPSAALLLLLSSLSCSLPSASQAPPKDLRDWELVCYCSGRVASPDEVVREDNNGQILFSARFGTTRGRLKADGIAVTESQVELLKNWRLLAERDDQLKTQMPLLGPDEINPLRARLHAVAVEVGGSLQPDFKNLVSVLAQRGYADNAYSIVFSYVLDGIVWDEFDQRHVLPSMEITVDKPLWSGAVWAIYPRRNSPGTNSRSYGGWHLWVTWTQSVQPFLTPLNDSSLTKPLLNELETQGSVSNPATRERLSALGILTTYGKPAVPIIHEVPTDPIYAVASTISRKVSDAMLRAMESPDVSALCGTDDKGVALIIAYHEFMWELLTYLEQAGVVHPPSILSKETNGDSRQIHDLVFIVVPQSK
jgi:hypothetical protein